MSGRRISLFAFFVAVVLALWTGLAWLVEVRISHGQGLAVTLFQGQDESALLLGAGALMALSLFVGARRAGAATGGRAAGMRGWQWARRGVVVVPLALLFALAARWGYGLLFGGYALSRDEQVAEFGAAALLHGGAAHHGGIGWPIPPEWIPYRRAIMPEFFSPFGADHVWTAAYLPLNSAFRALWGWLGDADCAGPAFLFVGLLALWRVALRLFPERPDAVAVALLMALGSTQLFVTAMTPYAMTGHFALNMLWLALLLRGGALGHGGAGLVLLLLTGLHQYHYPLPFVLPFLLWLALGRRWGALAFHGAVLVVAVLFWAKLWPHALIDLYGPAADVRPSAGVADKMDSLVDRLLAKWHPLLHLSRFLAWNDLLLVPLALVALWKMDWRAALRGQSLALPLALGAFGMAALSMDQGYGWGYRYLHGFIGSFALLAGYGWAGLRAPEGWARGRLLGGSLLVSVLTGIFLMARAHDYVAPYAAAHRRILASPADVVLVDPRGGRFVTDLVRGRGGAPLERPVVMNIGMLGEARVDALCARHSVAIFDRSAFLPLGVGAIGWGNARIAAVRAQLAARGCGALVSPGPRPGLWLPGW